ncbi:Protein N-acetyltransferase, RimJ/RimL family [Andreprevotia lacus DSM 23236]|jgi:RimJ/RimL family protein N-acetyltransferase|uniref:Protein N-acetyltransferase, RimJ/RimL family n=1 Tax=Andreprevotia lacus DSM 23236 TaxID=1121001 RepID=A0A1W1X8J6_9NEIS|nr:GNAT family protein [Andreprevotia lacus]SMC20239.1 Protein N-acetyltransferase, RimJ/RimL family [Andreprevotia lacus DSM 23236]
MTDHRFALAPKPLHNDWLHLEPYNDANRAGVQAALDCDAPGWQLFSFNGQGDGFDGWWAHVTARMAAGNWVGYALRDRASGEVVGTSCYLNINPAQQMVEIGGTFLRPDMRGGQVNPAAKLAMLQHAFASGARRVQLLTDARNLRSQAALAKLGAVREGVLRRDRITWTGHVRDSVLYAITDLDWPAVEQGLLARLGGR